VSVILEAPIEPDLLLGQPLLDLLELLPPLTGGVLELAARREQLLLGRQLRLADLRLAFAARLVEQALGALAGVG
jgi:hypothetical protein